MEDRDAIAEARDILAAGWCQGALHKNGKGYITEAFNSDRESSCMMGAIELVAQDQAQQQRLVRRVKKQIGKLVPMEDAWKTQSIPTFNDSKETTQEDVLLAMKYAEEGE